MPRVPLDLKDFNYGIIKHFDPMDIPIQAASDSNNIDGDAPDGKIQAISTAVEYKSSARGFDAKRSAWIVSSDGKWNLVYVSGDTTNALKVITDWYGSFADSGLSVAYNGYSFVVHNQECHIGCGTTNAPQWIGCCDYTQLGGGTTGWVSEDAEIPQVVNGSTTGVAVTAIAGAGSGAVFDANKTYIYKSSMIYDYTQESPLDAYGTFGLSGTSAYTTHNVTLSIINGVAVAPSKRLTGCKLYRAEQDDTNPTEVSLFRLIKTFDITGDLAHADYTWTAGGTPISGYHITWNDDNTIVGATYEQETGIAETINSSSVYYTLSCESNSSLIVGGCTKTGIPDASHMLFKSQVYRYDMFNWSAIGSFLKLPTQPTALVTFNNRVWAFDENNTYRIDTNSMTVEEHIFGVGCLSQRGITITPYGMFWCDAKNAYWHDGQTVTPIGEPIRSDTGDWHGFSTNYATDRQDKRPIVIFASAKNCILFIVPYDTGTDVTNVWAWHVVKKRWDSWIVFTPDCGSSCGAFIGKNGEVYIGDGTSKLYDAFGGGATKRAFYWTSSELPKEDMGQTKEFVQINTRTTSVTAAPSFTYGMDGATPTSSLTNSKFITSGDYEKGKTVKIKVTETTGYGNTISLIELIYRPMIGTR
jgi:hypothetical protein